VVHLVGQQIVLQLHDKLAAHHVLEHGAAYYGDMYISMGQH
jgi:hypothetical protein